MSAILGAIHFDGSKPDFEAHRVAARSMSLRGPDAHGFWSGGAGSVALSHQALWSTPEAMREVQPHVDQAALLCLVFDGRLDDRKTLALTLNSKGYPPQQDTDAELVLRAYQCWGEACAAQLTGDFAFAIWDGNLRRLYLARDVFGCRPLYFFHRQHGLFAFASTAHALLRVPKVPRTINEARIADVLIPGLEGIDNTSTFYLHIHRLEPAHWMSVDTAGLKTARYWKVEGNPEIRLSNDAEYEEAFLELFENAVQSSMRGGDRVGSMLSGGMDSGSIAAVASELALKDGYSRLRTYSAINEDLAGCSESRAIREALNALNILPETIGPSDIVRLEPELSAQTWNLEEPFDYHMIVPRAMYILGRRDGLKAMLDGGDGDSILSEGSFLPRLLHRGHWLKAWKEACGQNRFYFGNYPPALVVYQSMRAAFGPRWLRLKLRPMRLRQMVELEIKNAGISPDFARRVNVQERWESLMNFFWRRDPIDRATDMAGIIEHTYITSGIERYERVAAANGLESRHPFLYRPLVEFAARLPDNQKFRNGWPKYILRRAMRDKLPHAFTRYGKSHMGWPMTRAYLRMGKLTPEEQLRGNADLLSRFVIPSELERLSGKSSSMDDSTLYRAYELCHLANWLKQESCATF